MLLTGALPQPITSAPLATLVYVVLILMIGSALASVLLRNILLIVGAFAATMALVALLYLTIAPWQLFAAQLVLYTVVSAALLVAVLRDTSGLRPADVGPFSGELIVGAAVSAALLAVMGGVLAATTWPVRVCCALTQGLGSTLTTTYVVGLWTLAVLLGTAALGCGLALAAPRPGRIHQVEAGLPERERRPPRSGRR